VVPSWRPGDDHFLHGQERREHERRHPTDEKKKKRGERRERHPQRASHVGEGEETSPDCRKKGPSPSILFSGGGMFRNQGASLRQPEGEGRNYEPELRLLSEGTAPGRGEGSPLKPSSGQIGSLP